MSTDAEARSGWDLVRHGPFSRLFWAGFISSTGDWAALFAQISLADRIAGPTGILVVLAARLLPGLVGGAIGGILADRGSRKAVIVVTDIARGLLVLSLAWVGDLAPLFAVSVVLELLTLLGQPARAAVVPNLVHEKNILTANSLTLGSAYGTFPIGSAVAWVLGVLPAMTIFGLLPDRTEATIFAFDSLSFIASGLLVATMAIPPMKISDSGSDSSSRMCSLVIKCPAPGIGSGRGVEPVAMTILSPSSVTSPIFTRCGPTKRARPS